MSKLAFRHYAHHRYGEDPGSLAIEVPIHQTAEAKPGRSHFGWSAEHARATQEGARAFIEGRCDALKVKAAPGSVRAVHADAGAGPVMPAAEEEQPQEETDDQERAIEPESSLERQAIFEALGEVSMCWEPRPSGVFDSTRAEEVGRRLMERLKYEGAETQKRKEKCGERYRHFLNAREDLDDAIANLFDTLPEELRESAQRVAIAADALGSTSFGALYDEEIRSAKP